MSFFSRAHIITTLLSNNTTKQPTNKQQTTNKQITNKQPTNNQQTQKHNTKKQRRVFREETFGPTIPLFRFSDDDEALALANDTEVVCGGWFLCVLRVVRCALCAVRCVMCDCAPALATS